MPFVVQARIVYPLLTQETYQEERRRLLMNWIFEAYSNVYNAAMMQDRPGISHAATAKNSADSMRFSLFKPVAKG
jgi:hypothetical protein